MKHWWRRIWLLPVGLLAQLAAGADGAAGLIERFAGGALPRILQRGAAQRARHLQLERPALCARPCPDFVTFLRVGIINSIAEMKS